MLFRTFMKNLPKQIKTGFVVSKSVNEVSIDDLHLDNKNSENRQVKFDFSPYQTMNGKK